MAHDTPVRPEPTGASVLVRLPAERAYASVLRTTAAALAARLDFTIDDIEDLRIAIGEATALALPEADPGTDLTCEFTMGTGEVSVVVRVEAVDEPDVDRDSFAWQVLDTLATHATAGAADGHLTVTFTVRSEIQQPLTGVGS